MPHLLSPRTGWENERLASYLLSRFSFVAQPVTIADDRGSDFSCTMFEIVRTQSGRDALLPRSSFAIQVKSSMDTVPMNNKIEYLRWLDLLFFIGVVNQPPPEMGIYSGELLPMMFAFFGIPDRMSLTPVTTLEPGQFSYEFVKDSPNGMIRILCPLVVTLSTHEDRSTLAPLSC